MAMTSWAARVTIGSIMTERASAAAKPVFPYSMGHHPEEVDEEAGDDGRGAGHGVDDCGDDRQGAVVADQVGGGEDAEGHGEDGGDSTCSMVPTMAAPTPRSRMWAFPPSRDMSAMRKWGKPPNTAANPLIST